MDHGSLDVVVQPLGDRTKKLLIADMDSTMISCECIDELADYAGIKAEVAAITKKAMRGEVDFRGALMEGAARPGGLAAGGGGGARRGGGRLDGGRAKRGARKRD